MFVIINSFKVKSGKTAEFEEAWHDLTEQLYVHSGSLGARLHKTEHGEYIGYSQWPEKETWSNALDKIPKKYQYVRQNLSSCCTETKNIFNLDIIADLLMPKVFSF